MAEETTSRYDIPLKDWRMGDLVAELELYQKAGSITPEMMSTLTNNDKRLDAIKSLQGTIGEPYVVTVDDTKVNPMLKVGDVIIVPMEADKSSETTEPEQTTGATAPVQPSANTVVGADPIVTPGSATATDPVMPVTPPGSQVATGMNVGESRDPVQAVGAGGKLRPENTIEKQKQLYYGGKPIISTTNKLNNGKIYVEVVTAESSHLLSEVEFKSDVTEKA